MTLKSLTVTSNDIGIENVYDEHLESLSLESGKTIILQ